MADSHKGSATSTDPKKKNSSLDEEIGNEFFSSWKSLSTARDDSMDFSFETVSSGNKKAFNFDKLDMDFNLDGDFDKLTSFKVDMPDLDFSSPSGKTAEPKDNSKGDSSSGNHQKKGDYFNFSFDFNALDNFNFDSNLLEGEKTSMKNMGIKEADGDSGEHQRPKVNPAGDDYVKRHGSKINVAGQEDGQHKGSKIKPTSSDEGEHHCSKDNLIDADDDKTDKFRGSENKTITIDDAGAEISSSENFNSGAGNTDLVVSHGAKLLPQEKIFVSTEEKDRQCHFLEKMPYDQQVSQKSSIEDVDGNDLSRDKESDVPSFLTATVDTVPSTELNASDKVNDCESDHGNLCLKNSAASCTKGLEGNEGRSENTYGESPTTSIKESEPKPDDLDLQATYAASPLQETQHESKVDNDIHESTPKILVPLTSATLIRTLSPIEEKDSGVACCSKFFKSHEETKPQLSQPSSAASKVSLFGSKGISSISPANGSAQVTGKVMPSKDKGSEVVPSKVFMSSKDIVDQLCQPTSVGLKISFRSEGISFPCPANGKRAGSNVDEQRKPTCNPAPVSMELTKGHAFPGSRKNVKNTSNISCKANLASLTGNEIKSTAQTSSNCMKMIQVEGLKSGKRMPDLSCLKISRSIGVSKDKSNPVLEREINSQKNLDENVEVQGIAALKIIHPIVKTEGKTLLLPSSKRKLYEVPNDNLGHLNPQKRLSQSPVESSIVKKTLESTAEEQQVRDTTSALYNHSSAGLKLPQQSSPKERHISLESHGNVEKAEAYAKGLDDICSTLKKMNEEAKELLVRAVVNNNRLLLLKDPKFDEKIRLAQKLVE